MSGATSYTRQPRGKGKDNRAEPLDPTLEDTIILKSRAAQALLTNVFSIRQNLENIDRNYMRELDTTEDTIKAAAANNRGDVEKLRNLIVPVVMPQVNTALGYMTEVFLTGYPIFGVVADAVNQEAAEQIEAIIAENSITAGWHQQLLMFFRDGLKYNIHALELEWQQRKLAKIVNDINSPTNARTDNVLWNGNVIRRMDMYNTFFDPRVHPTQIHSKGEFAGYVDLMSRVQLQQYFDSMITPPSREAQTRALASSYGGMGAGVSSVAPFGYYQPILNPAALVSGAASNRRYFDWMAWAGIARENNSGISYTNIYARTRIYMRIVPKDFNMEVPGRSNTQVWMAEIINGTVVIRWERCAYLHDFIPIFFGQPIEDGLDYQTKSFATNVMDMQHAASAMLNGFIQSKRRLVTDRVLYDPTRIAKKDINSSNPSAKIPVRPSAYGKPLNEAVHQFPFRDENANSFMVGLEEVIKLSNLINGQNPAQQGQFVKGNKTRKEFEDIMGNGNLMNKMMALNTEMCVFVPLKEAIKLNILQNQQPGTIVNPYTQKSAAIDPLTLRKMAVQFKVSDGMMPSEKLIGGDVLMVGLQVLGQSEAIAREYNVGEVFGYLLETQGADISQFKKTSEQIQYEQALNAWQQMAMQAMKMGAPFNTPMPQPPPVKPPKPSPETIAITTTQGTP